MAAQSYNIPNFLTISPLGGIAEAYKMYKDIEREGRNDEYAREKDARGFGIQEEHNRLTEARNEQANEYHLAHINMEGAKIQEAARLKQAEIEWAKDPNNPDSKYKLAMGSAAGANAYNGSVDSQLKGLQQLLAMPEVQTIFGQRGGGGNNMSPAQQPRNLR